MGYIQNEKPHIEEWWGKNIFLSALSVNFAQKYLAQSTVRKVLCAKYFARSTLREVLCAKYFAQSTLR